MDFYDAIKVLRFTFNMLHQQGEKSTLANGEMVLMPKKSTL